MSLKLNVTLYCHMLLLILLLLLLLSLLLLLLLLLLPLFVYIIQKNSYLTVSECLGKFL